MTLLDTVIAAAASKHAVAAAAPSPSPPTLVDLADIYPTLTLTDPNPPFAGAPPPPLRLAGWRRTSDDNDDDFHRSMKKLGQMVEHPNSTSKDKVWAFINSAFPLEKLSAFSGTHVVHLIADACVAFGLWEMLETMVELGYFAVGESGRMVEKLVSKRQIGMILVYLKRLTDPRGEVVRRILGCFLNPRRETYRGMVEVRREWERQGLFAAEKAVEYGIPKEEASLWKEAAVLLMMAHDGFTPSECCLHYLFSVDGLEGLAMASAMEGLDGEEVVRLVRYFGKWVEKYRRFPQAVPCTTASHELGLVACENIPSLVNVATGLGLVANQHFGFLVMNPEVREDMKALEGVVGELASGANACCRLANAVEALREDQWGGVGGRGV